VGFDLGVVGMGSAGWLFAMGGVPVRIDDLIEAAKKEESYRRMIYKRLELNEFVSHDYAASRIGEMVHIAQALQCLKAKGVERLEGNCERPTQGSAETAAQDADRSKPQGRNGKNRQKCARGAA
jgi:hypothetical protein